ncbi:NAD(P)-binding domain-containing protein [Pontibacter sp. G13]|uniref:flavin-containing monooxygenase n=1 Tax=Pontibacter sp. G13 TaxID=3074898 RepID=UPI00288A24E5|nr:NAD(P)-binding domain-containing protein [Pontibacter sp. G13]WNJ16858.1 NAD(P)-binding domain-containing protein [Pontibacter sp. G13]
MSTQSSAGLAPKSPRPASSAYTRTSEKYAIIGAGPSGLGTARCFKEYGIPFDMFEAHNDVGGLWNIENPSSTVYETAHLISSKRMTEFEHFPMKDEVPDFPRHHDLCAYFKDYATAFGLYEHTHFNTRIRKVEPLEDKWQIILENGDAHIYKGVVIANGCLSHPNVPTFDGHFNGEIMHSCDYKHPEIFEGKRVLIVGAGNSGCDIAVDAVHRASKVSMSVRRGYHFVPKYVFGKPADTMGGAFKMPPKIKQKVDKFLLKFFIPDPQKLGFPEPDHKLYESHPVVNNLVLHHLGHGDMDIKRDIDRLDGDGVCFKDGTREEYDMVLLATGYKLNYPFIDQEHLNWVGDAPKLYLNIFPPQYDNLFVIGMVEATGLGWQGRYKQSELVAQFLINKEAETTQASKFSAEKRNVIPDTTGGLNYMKLARMSYYVHKETYLDMIAKHMKRFEKGAASFAPTGTPAS